MKICFAQPQTAYKVHANLNALALTFPHLISDLELALDEYVVYIGNLDHRDFSLFLDQYRPTHVFMTTITCTFPEAARLARIARSKGIVTVLGGIFTSMNADIIHKNFDAFDYIVKGNPTRDLLVRIDHHSPSQRILEYPARYQSNKPLAGIITDPQFQAYYGDHQVCYELTNGCVYSCSFCSMRTAWGQGRLVHRSFDQILSDLTQLSRHWTKLKIIDDDFLQAYRPLQGLSIKGLFKQVIIETRVDRITEASAKFLRDFGATHVLLGVENFVEPFLRGSRKKRNPVSWELLTQRALCLCGQNNIMARPIVMLTSPHATMSSARSLVRKMKQWTPSNGIEVFFSLYTPHPGLPMPDERGALLTNDLTLFDHVHLVYLPGSFAMGELESIISTYEELVETTGSRKYNPPMNVSRKYYREYECFFSKDIEGRHSPGTRQFTDALQEDVVG